MSHPAAILTPQLRARVQERVLELSRALARPHDEWILSQRPDNTGLRTVSLAMGRSGSAVFEAWLYRSGLDDAAGDRAVGHLQDIVERLPQHTMDLSLHCGFPSVAWTLEHLAQLLELDLGGDMNATIDETILEALANSQYTPAYDLIGGLAGLLVYALERLERPTGQRLMEAVLQGLESTAMPQPVGVSWPSGQVTRTAFRHQIAPDESYFNLGMSHGVPGVVGALARLHAVDEYRARVAPMLEGSADWLAAQRLPGDPADRGLFPDYVAPGAEPEPARLAWCYGDPGVAAALVSAGVALDREDLFEFGLATGRAGAARRDEGNGVVDDGLCHGSAGLTHAFHRLYQVSGDEVLRDASLRWLEKLLERKEHAPHIAGFTTFCFERTVDGETIEDPAWLTGAVGVGLVLLSLLEAPEVTRPGWDRPLLLDLPR